MTFKGLPFIPPFPIWLLSASLAMKNSSTDSALFAQCTDWPFCPLRL